MQHVLFCQHTLIQVMQPTSNSISKIKFYQQFNYFLYDVKIMILMYPQLPDEYDKNTPKALFSTEST